MITVSNGLSNKGGTYIIAYDIDRIGPDAIKALEDELARREISVILVPMVGSGNHLQLIA